LRRLGHEVLAYDPVGSIRQGRLLNALHYRTGYVWAAGPVRRQLLPWIRSQRASFDVIWVDNGEMIGARTLRELKPLTRWLVITTATIRRENVMVGAGSRCCRRCRFMICASSSGGKAKQNIRGTARDA
jgi:hypothetical protein